MKKGFLFIGVFLTVLFPFLLNTDVYAEEYHENDMWKYYIDSNYEAHITGYIGTSTSVTVPEYIGGYKVVSIYQLTFYNLKNLRYLEIPKGVTFHVDSELLNYDDRKGRSVGYPFDGCDNLEKVVFLDGVTTIDGELFRYCTSLKEVELPTSVTSIEYYAFFGCTNLYKIEVPSSVKSIGKNAFYGVPYVVLPDGLTDVGDQDWNTIFICDEKVAQIGGLKDCQTYRPNQVMEKAGRNIDVSFDIDNKTLTFSGKGNMYDDYVGKSHILKCLKNVDINVEFKTTNLTVLPSKIFWGYEKLSNIVIPESVKTVETYAFGYCKNLSTFSGKGVVFVGKYAFSNCYLLKTVSLPDEIKYTDENESEFGVIESKAFENCSSLESFTIPDGYKTIREKVFYECVNLENITLPKSLNYIGGSAFYKTALSEITIPGNLTVMGDHVFSSCTELVKVVIEEGVSYLPAYAFDSCTSLNSISIPNTVNIIGKGAFYGCTGLTSITLPNTVSTILEDTFNGCAELTSIIIPNSVTELKAGVFAECNKLQTIKISSSIESIPNGAFWGCNELDNIIIPNSVKNIESCAFKNCSKLCSIIIPSSVETIEVNAFDYCENLVIYGVQGSYAEKYAKLNGIRFETHTHSYIDQDKIAPTCTEVGYAAGKCCSVCGYIPEQREEIPALGHSWDEWVVVKEATDTEEGLEVRVCKRDSSHKETRTIPVKSTEGNQNQNTSDKDNSNSADQKQPTKTDSSSKSNTESGKQATTQNNTLPQQSGINAGAGVGTLSSDGRVLTDTQGKKWKVASFIDYYNIKNNLAVADKKSGGKYKIISVIKRNGKVTGGKVSYLAPYNISIKKATIPKTIKLAGAKFTVVSINEKAFKDCKNLASVTISENVTSIGARAFNGCSKLKTVTIKSSSLKSIGKNAFKGINAKVKFKLPNKKLEKYTKMIRKAGVPKKATFTK